MTRHLRVGLVWFCRRNGERAWGRGYRNNDNNDNNDNSIDDDDDSKRALRDTARAQDDARLLLVEQAID
jgi:hypothetical protein